jgi:hypothetical protein
VLTRQSFLDCHSGESRMFLHGHPASFDELRLKGNLTGTKKTPHPENVEGRTSPIQFSHPAHEMAKTPFPLLFGRDSALQFRVMQPS